jgi:acetylornithine/succinyldiaminopimelate/putrescine aminotransferase
MPKTVRYATLSLEVLTSKILQAVVLEGQSDLELRATVIAQRFKAGHLQNAQRNHNQLQLLKRIREHPVARNYPVGAGSNAFAGATRLSEACEGAVRENKRCFYPNYQGTMGVMNPN